MSTQMVPDAFEIFDRIFAPRARQLMARQHALKLAADEFKLDASLKGMSFVTARNRSRRLAHFEDHSYTVWRRGLSGAELVRIVSRALCGQWIMQAKPSDWMTDEPRCIPCENALRVLIERYRAEEANA